jgi:riboflavin synthase
MFTGIVEELGEVEALTRRGDSARLTLGSSLVAQDVRHGASISVSGVCLTVVGARPATVGDGWLLDFDVMGETLERSAVGALQVGDQVNLERAVRADARLDGHVVQGHVDGTGVILSRTPGDGWESVRMSLPPELSRYVALKGSIAVDGISLTVAALGAGGADGSDWFEVGLIPETLRVTTLGGKAVGDRVNLETDVLAKYADRLLQRGARP